MIESYSAFGDTGENTNLGEILHKNGVTTVYCVGLAYDYCVGSTALCAAKKGFKTFIIKDATKSVSNRTEKLMNKKLEEEGVKLINSRDILGGKMLLGRT